MFRLEKLRKHLRPGQVYRRAQFEKWSSAIDRDLHRLVEEGTLTKLAGGLYYRPKKTAFGKAPADAKVVVKAFLKDRRFLITTPNAYNVLGVGTTQLYNTTVVYNRKRHGRFDLGGRVFEFKKKPYFPSNLTAEFLLVDLVNNVKDLAEDADHVLGQVKKRASSMDRRALSNAVQNYGSASAKRFFARVLSNDTLQHAVH